MEYAEYASVPENITDSFDNLDLGARVQVPREQNMRQGLPTIPENTELRETISAPIDVLEALETIKKSVNSTETASQKTLREVRTDLIRSLVKIEKQLNKEPKTKTKKGLLARKCVLM